VANGSDGFDAGSEGPKLEYAIRLYSPIAKKQQQIA
jgi:hypothetical protein